MPRQRKSNRRQRTPFGVARLKMNLDPATMQRLKAEDKIPRWINDTGNRITAAREGDYEFVHDTKAPVRTGDNKEVQEQDRRIRMRVGKHEDGSPMYAYLMAIPAEFYQEDQDAKEERNKMVDTAIKGGQPNGLNHHGVDEQQGSTYVKNIKYEP